MWGVLMIHGKSMIICNQWMKIKKTFLPSTFNTEVGIQVLKHLQDLVLNPVLEGAAPLPLETGRGVPQAVH